MEDIFKIKNEDGVERQYKVLHYFNKNSNNYLIYTESDNEEDVLAAKYVKEKSTFNLIPIENDEEWNIVDEEWGRVNEKN